MEVSITYYEINTYDYTYKYIDLLTSEYNLILAATGEINLIGYQFTSEVDNHTIVWTLNEIASEDYYTVIYIDGPANYYGEGGGGPSYTFRFYKPDA